MTRLERGTFSLTCLWVLLIGLVAGQARAEPDCDLDTQLTRIHALMQVQAPEEQVLPLLEQALACPAAELDFDLHLYLLLVRLRLGQVEAALEAARQAYTAAGPDDARREQARAIQTLIEREVYTVTFVLPDGSEQAAAVKLERVEPDSLPDAGALQAVFPKTMAAMCAGTYARMVVAAIQASAVSDREPLRLWLPRGIYTLGSGQRVRVSGEIGNLIVTVVEPRWAPITLGLHVRSSLLVPLGDQRYRAPLLIGGTLRADLRLPNDLLLSAQLGLAEGAGRTEVLEHVAALEPTMRQGALAELSLGISRVAAVSRRVQMLLGVSAGVGSIGWQEFLVSVPVGESVSSDTFVAASLNPLVRPHAQFLWRLPSFSGLDGAASVGAGAEVGYGFAWCDPCQGATNEGSSAASGRLVPVGPWLAPMLQLGANLLF